MAQDIGIISEKKLSKSLKKIKNLKKRTKIILGIILILILVSLFFIFKPQKPVYESTEVKRGTVVEEISVNGTIEAANEIDLKFKTNGTIEKVLVNIGDKVKKGTALVRLETGEVYSQYLQAQATYNQAKAKLDQLLAGTTMEEIKISEQVVANARVSFDDAKAKAENDLNQKYNSALSYLVSSSSKCNKAITDMKDIEKTYFSEGSAISKEFIEKRSLAEEAFVGNSANKGAQELVELALDDPTQINIDSALSGLWTALQKTIVLLDFAKTAASEPTFIGKVSSTDKSTITTDAGEVATAFINIINSQTDISNQKITNQVNINSAENTFKKAELDLEKLKAPPRDVDIAVYRADVERYKANFEEYSQKLNDASIIAPFDGEVAKIDGKIGEVVTAGTKTIITLLSPNNFEIKADIPETDIGEVSMDDEVEISIDALPEETYKGEILEIDPAETLIDGVVYYRVTILFDEPSQKIRSGMSGDVVIKTAVKENVLYVPQRAVITRNGDKMVRVLNGEEFQEFKIVTGLRGSDGEIEIISGLSEGQKIITYLKLSK